MVFVKNLLQTGFDQPEDDEGEPEPFASAGEPSTPTSCLAIHNHSIQCALHRRLHSQLFSFFFTPFLLKPSLEVSNDNERGGAGADPEKCLGWFKTFFDSLHAEFTWHVEFQDMISIDFNLN